MKKIIAMIMTGAIAPLTDCLQQFVRLRPVPFFQRNILRQHGRRFH